MARYAWDAGQGRYRLDGRTLGAEAVRRALDAVLEAERSRLRMLAEDYRGGRLALRAWALAMREAIKSTLLLAAAAAVGGWAQLTAQDLQRVEAAIARQYAYLARFVQDLEAGLPRDGAFLARAEQYGLAGRTLHHELEREVRLAAGDTEERNILHPADHCGPGADSCPAQSALGWVPIGTLLPLGQRQCRANDQCSIAYR